MLTPEDFEELKPKFEEIRQLLNAGHTISSDQGMSDEACGYYTIALGHIRQIGWCPPKCSRAVPRWVPCIATPESIPDRMSLALDLVQYRGGKEIARSEVPARLNGPPEEVVASTVAHDSPPDLVIQYTGGFAAIPDFPLQAGDVVRITMEGVGFVQNTVEVV